LIELNACYHVCLEGANLVLLVNQTPQPNNCIV
jgi:hypothetical protein